MSARGGPSGGGPPCATPAGAVNASGDGGGLGAYVDEARRMNEALRSRARIGAALSTPEGLAALRRDMAQRAEANAAGVVPDRQVSIGVPLRVFACDDAKAVYLSIHGGGWLLGSARQDDPESRRIACGCDVAVVSVDYRLAPEHPHPAAVDDCVRAARWVLERGLSELGADRLIVGGYSAGATLAVLTLLQLRDDGVAPERLAGANLRYGAYDFGMTPSQRRSADALVIDAEYLAVSRPMIFPHLSPEERRDASVSPLYADLTGMPRALLTVGRLDPFVDDSLFLAARWRLAGGSAQVDVYPESPHGFDHLPTEMAAAARSRTDAFVRACAHGGSD